MVSNGNNSIEFFIEGGRSRDGKVGHPRLGLLSLVVDASLEEKLNRRVCPHLLAVAHVSEHQAASPARSIHMDPVPAGGVMSSLFLICTYLDPLSCI